MSIEIKCSKCNQLKLEEHFFRCSSRKNGRQSYCKICWVEYMKPYKKQWERKFKRIRLADGTRQRVLRTKEN